MSNDEVDLSDAIVGELMDAFEKKDKQLLVEALRALIHQIQDADAMEDVGND